MGNERKTPTTTQKTSVAPVTDMEAARRRQKWEGLKAQRADEERRALMQEIEELKQVLAKTEAEVSEGEDIAYGQFDRAERYKKEVEAYRREREEIGRQNSALVREFEESCEVMKRQILGWEIFKARLANVLIEHGLNPQSAMPQNEEEELIAGRMPDGLSYANLEYILAEYRGTLCFDDAEVDRALNALFPEPEVPEPPRTVRSQPVLTRAVDGDDPLKDFVVKFTSEPRPRSIPPESENDASSEGKMRPRQDTLGYEELVPFNPWATSSSEAPAVPDDGSDSTDEEGGRGGEGWIYEDLCPFHLSASAPPVPVLKPVQEDPEVPDHAWDEEPETNHSLTIGFDPRFDPDEPPSRAAILPPSELRPEGWKPPKVQPMGVVRSGDPDVRRRTEERAKHRK